MNPSPKTTPTSDHFSFLSGVVFHQWFHCTGYNKYLTQSPLLQYYCISVIERLRNIHNIVCYKAESAPLKQKKKEQETLETWSWTY